MQCMRGELKINLYLKYYQINPKQINQTINNVFILIILFLDKALLEDGRIDTN